MLIEPNLILQLLNENNININGVLHIGAHEFTKEQIEKLLEIKWWFWEDDIIEKNVHLLCNKNIDNFINLYIT